MGFLANWPKIGTVPQKSGRMVSLTIAIITKLIAALLTKKQQLTIMIEKQKNNLLNTIAYIKVKFAKINQFSNCSSYSIKNL